MAACTDNYAGPNCYRFKICDTGCKFIKICGPPSSNFKSCVDSISISNSNSINNYSLLHHTAKAIRCEDHIWLIIREDALSDIEQEPILSDYYHSTILSHKTLENALATNLAAKLSNPLISMDTLYRVFLKQLVQDAEIRTAIRDDLIAWKERDPACLSYMHCFMNFKGFLACQAQRIAHGLWKQGRSALALLIQSRVSEAFAVDIHPGARIGKGVVFDHATGVVIGETAVIGDNATILHNVTLGGTGKGQGDRHPKIGDGVLIGAGSNVLGNIRIGDGAKIGAGSVVLKEVPSKVTAVGNPAKVISLNKGR